MMNPRADSIYGRSAVESLMDVIQLLIYGVDSNLDYFRDSNIPKGVFEMINANQTDVNAFKEAFQQNMMKKDPAGNWRRYWHKMPIISTEGKFERIAFSNVELELLQQQQWFTKIVWACFNVTASELGFTEDSNRSTEVVQSSVYKRKLIRPLVEHLEYHFNTEIINDLPWMKGYEDKVKFVFDRYDIEEELGRRKVHWEDIKTGLKTVNEIREELSLDPKEGGDELRGQGSQLAIGGDTSSVMQDTTPMEDNQQNEKVDKETRDKKKIKKKSTNELKSCVDPSLSAPGNYTETQLKKLLNENLNKTKAGIKALIKKEAGVRVLENIKSIDMVFIKRLLGLMTLNIMGPAVKDTIKSAFYKGQEVVGKKLEKNFVPNENSINFLQDYTFENVDGLNEELKNRLRGELQRGLIEGEGVKALSKRVDKVMDMGKVRADTIARTEVSRAENMGTYEGYLQSGFDGTKEWVATVDRTCPICKALDGQTVPLKSKFNYKGKEVLLPPFHPNCFLKDTKIRTDNGNKNIQDVEVGDLVLTHKNRFMGVTKTMSREANEYFEIEVGNGKNNRKLKVTGEHPVMTQNGWKLVKDLDFDDRLVML